MSDEPVDLFRRNIPQEIIELVPRSVAIENRLIPIEVLGERTLVVAMDNVEGRKSVVDKLQFILNKNIEPLLASSSAIDFAIERYYSS